MWFKKENINVTINQVVKKQETQTSPRFTGVTPGLKNEIEKEKKYEIKTEKR